MQINQYLTVLAGYAKPCTPDDFRLGAACIVQAQQQPNSKAQMWKQAAHLHTAATAQARFQTQRTNTQARQLHHCSRLQWKPNGKNNRRATTQQSWEVHKWTNANSNERHIAKRRIPSDQSSLNRVPLKCSKEEQ
jgi:hypothetical protein